MTAFPPDHICEARRFGERMHCGRCELHGFAPDIKALPCKPAAGCGLTVTVIRDAIEATANDLDYSMDVASRVSAAMKINDGAPDPRLLRRSAGLRAGLRFIDQGQGKKGSA